MQKTSISARNMLGIPIRLTLTEVSDGREDSRILITVGKEGAELKGYYRVCIDTDLPPGQDWDDIGLLCIDTKCKVSLEGQTGA